MECLICITCIFLIPLIAYLYLHNSSTKVITKSIPQLTPKPLPTNPVQPKNIPVINQSINKSSSFINAYKGFK